MNKKDSTSFSKNKNRIVGTLMLLFTLILSSSVFAAAVYVRPYGDATSWNNIPGATITTLTSGNVLPTTYSDGSTYYLAPGTYKETYSLTVSGGSKVYGGFSGQETSIDLNARALSDKDGNGIIEPWEFTNEAIFTTSGAAYTFTGAGPTNGTRLLVITGTNSEVNGLTITDFNYFTYSGPICVGAVFSGSTNDPAQADNVSGKEGILRFCTVKKIKSKNGIVTSSNKYSIIDRCLIESNVITGGVSWGGSIFFNLCGGKATGCVVRNNSGGRGAGIQATSFASTDMDAIVENCVVYNNFASGNGGAIRGDAQTSKRGIQIVNSTIVNNQTATTASTAIASVELISGGLIANSIIVGDPSAEVRPNTTNNYILNNAYGEYATGASTLYGSDNVTGKAVSNFNFTRPTSSVGVMIPDYTTPWVQATYDAIRQANYYITSTSSTAYTTSNASIPSSFQIGGTGTTVNITATVPATDINGATRNTIGAYNYDGTTPTITISSSSSNPTYTSPIPITITFSENVTGFDVTDLTIGNGTASNFIAVSPKVFTVTVSPTTYGAVTVDIAANAAKDGAGNNSSAASQFSISYQLLQTAPVGVTTTSVSAITYSTATSGVAYTSNGNSTIAEYGVVWSTSPNPDANANGATKTTNGTGLITGLLANTTYYTRAYATNSIGTSYGSEFNFTTLVSYSIAVSSADVSKGTVSISGGTYDAGASISLTATPVAGKRFLSWTEGESIVSSTPTYVFTASSNRTLVANFGNAYNTYYVRPTGSTKWSNIGAGTDQIIETDNFSLAYNTNNVADGTATYYFAAGNYTMLGFTITTGKLYGGFTGDESTIDLNTRTLSDLDSNGIVEPWEFTNAAVFSGPTGFKYADNSSGIGSRLLIVSGTGGEANGITLTDFSYLTYSGPISLGQASGTPSAPNNNEGKLTKCIVRKIKSAIGIVMLTNPGSIVYQCLIEDCYGTSYGAIYINKYGGVLSNSVVRNNYATTQGGAIYAGNGATATDLKAIVKNCLIYNNTAGTKGGAISSKSVDATHGGIEIVNSTIVNNSTGSGNASVEFDGPGLIVNSIVTGDSKADLYATSTSNYLNGVVYGTTGSGTAILSETNTVSGKNTSDLSFERSTATPGYLGLTVDANYTAMLAAKFNITNLNSPAVTTSAGNVASYNSINTYSSVPTTDITGFSRTGTKTMGAYQATLDVANGSPVTISQNASLAALTVAAGGQLTLDSGKTLSVGTLALQSSASGTGTIVNNGTLNTTTTNVQQYLTTGRNWYISSPVSASSYTSVSSATTLQYWNEATGSWAIKSTGTLTPGKGFISVGTTSTGNIIFSGTLNDGDITVNLTRTHGAYKAGFNLVGNPYPSYLSWDDVIKTNVGTTIWYRAKSTNAYKFGTYNATSHIGTNLGTTSDSVVTKNIPPMQAFWVRVNSPVIAANDTVGSIQFTNNMRSHKGIQLQGDDVTRNDGILRTKALNTSQVLRLQISNGINDDEAIVLFNSNASNGIDDYDSPKMSNNSASIPEIYTLAGNEQVVINGVNDLTQLTLGFSTGQANNFTIKASQFTNFTQGTQIVLRDNLLNNEQDLIIADYNFYSDATANNETRFTLLFRAPSVATGINSDENSCIRISTNANGEIQINGTTNGETTVTVHNALGQKLMSKRLTQGNTQLGASLQAGVYMVSVTNNGKTILKKMIID